MNRGISFSFPEQMTYGGFSGIFDGIETDSLIWKNILSQCEVICGSDVNIPETCAYDDLLAFLRKEPYIISVKLQAYPEGGSFEECHTYEEFLSGGCKLMLLICDVREADIYAKDQDVIETIYRNALKCGFENVRILTDENDKRTRLDVINYD